MKITHRSGILPWMKVFIEMVPTSPGVYILRSHDQSILYIGSSENIKDRLTTHWMRVKSGYIGYFDWYQTSSEKDATILEANWIRRYQPVLNTRQKGGE